MIAIIVAMSENRVIGREGKIPWDLPEDRKKFQMLTMGNAIVMGRRTYDEIGPPLPGRMTYLLSGTKKVELENCHTVQSLEEVWEKEKNTGRDIFICGGASVYEEALKNTDKIYVTKLLEKVEGDTFFPMFSEEEFVEKSCEILVPQKAVFYEYERVQKKGKFMLSTLKDLWYDGKMVTKEKQLRIFDEKSGKWEVFSPVIFQNCMRPEEVTIYPLTITLLAEDRIQIETKYQQREFDLKDKEIELCEWEAKIHKVECTHCENCGRCGW